MLFMLALSGTLLFAQNGSISISISGIARPDGFCRVILFNSSQGFPSTYANGFRDTSIARPKSLETLTLNNLPTGTYAVSILHDQNGNGKMDSGLFGIPKEPYGVSNNVYPKTRAPKFEECAFEVNAGNKTSLHVRMKNP